MQRTHLVLAMALLAAACSSSSPSAPSDAPAAPTPVAPPPPTPMTGIVVENLTPNPAVAGTVFRVQAVGSGGTKPYQFKFVLRQADGTPFTMRDWSYDPTYGAQLFSAMTTETEVWGRSNGYLEDAPQVSTKFVLTATAAPVGGPITGITVSSSVLGPRPAEQPVIFTAHPYAGVAPYQVKWFVNGQVVQDWTTSLSWTWVPARSGNYSIEVWGRSAGATEDVAQASSRFNFMVTAPGPQQMSAIRLGEFTQTKQGNATVVTLQFSGEGGTPPYQFLVRWRPNSEPFTLIRDWSGDTRISFSITATGSQDIQISGRSAGSTGAAEISSSHNFYVTP